MTPDPNPIFTAEHRAVMAMLGKRGGRSRSKAKLDAIRKNGSMPVRPGSLPRGGLGVKLARERRPAMEAAGLIETQPPNRDNPVVQCVRRCGFRMAISNEMSEVFHKGQGIKWVCPRCKAPNLAKPYRRLPKIKFQTPVDL